MVRKGRDLHCIVPPSLFIIGIQIKIRALKLPIKWQESTGLTRWNFDNNNYNNLCLFPQILHNDDKRRRYDILGEESDDAPPSNKPDTRNYLTPSDSVSSMQFMNHLKSYSKKRPYLIYYYHDFCPACLSWTEKWEELRTVMKQQYIVLQKL